MLRGKLRRIVTLASVAVLSLGLTVGSSVVAPAPVEAAARVKVVKKATTAFYGVPGYPRVIKAKVTKPVFLSGATAKIRNTFNAKINAVVKAEIASFRKEMIYSLENWTPGEGMYGDADPTSELNILTKSMYIYQGRYISVSLYTWGVPFLAASGCHGSFATYTYDTKTGRFVKLAALVNTNHNQLFWSLMKRLSSTEYGEDIVTVDESGSLDTTLGALPQNWSVTSAGVTFGSEPGGPLSGFCATGPIGLTVPWNQVLTASGAKGSTKTYKSVLQKILNGTGRATVRVKGSQVEIIDGWGVRYWGVRGTGKTMVAYNTQRSGSWMEGRLATVTFASKSAKAKPIRVAMNVYAD